MMTELWWKAFLGAIVTTAAAKALGCRWGMFLLFAAAFSGCAAALILLTVISGFLQEKRKNEK